MTAAAAARRCAQTPHRPTASTIPLTVDERSPATKTTGLAGLVGIAGLTIPAGVPSTRPEKRAPAPVPGCAGIFDNCKSWKTGRAGKWPGNRPLRVSAPKTAGTAISGGSPWQRANAMVAGNALRRSRGCAPMQRVAMATPIPQPATVIAAVFDSNRIGLCPCSVTLRGTRTPRRAPPSQCLPLDTGNPAAVDGSPRGRASPVGGPPLRVDLCDPGQIW